MCGIMKRISKTHLNKIVKLANFAQDKINNSVNCFKVNTKNDLHALLLSYMLK